MADQLEVSVVVPVYRSGSILPRLIERLVAVLEDMGRSYEVVLVDDGSRDDSWAVLSAQQREHPEKITAVRLMRNYGQHNALMCGFRHARGRYIVTIDDDLQNPPEEIPKLLKKLEDDELDVVYGHAAEKQHAAWRNLGTWMVRRFYRIIFKNPVRMTSFRAIRGVVLNGVFSYDLNFTFVDGLLAWNSERIGEVEVEHAARKTGSSGYSLARLLALSLNLVTNFSLLPLQVVSACGVLAAIGGLGTGAYYITLSLTQNIAVPGYASIIVAVLILGGVQLLALGIMGEYLGRLHLNVNRKPQYAERVVISAAPSAGESAP